MNTPALDVRNVSKSYGPEHALAGLNLTVTPGDIHAIVGLNGAGKTTLMRACTGMLSLDSGTIAVLGHGSPEPAVWARAGHMIDHPFAYPELSVEENLVVACRLHGVPAPPARALAAEWIQRFELSHWARRRARTLSMGNRQRLGLAAALAHSPDLVILDEPTNALDPAGVMLLRDAIVERAAEGAGVLVSSHHLDEVARTAHTISVVHAGRVIGTLSPGGTDLERQFFSMVHAYDATAREDT